MGPNAEKAAGSADKTENVHPAFIGIKFYPGTDYAISAINEGLLDQTSYGIRDFKDLQTASADPNDYLHLWYHDNDLRSYTAQGPPIELVFNTLKYPMSEHWFREAISKAIDYAPISSVASVNNWIRGSPTYLNPKYNPEHLAIFDQEIHDDYMYEYNASAAKKLFTDAGAYQKREFNKMKWFIDAPAQGSVPLATLYDESTTVDADPDKAGVQMEIGPYLILTPYYWWDTNIAVDYWATSISASLDLQVEKNQISFPFWESSLVNTEFDLAMWTAGPLTTNSPYRMFNSLVQDQTIYGNVSSWRGANAVAFANALIEYETAESYPVEQIAASNLQRAYAEDIPTISSHINNFWYQYSTQYWKGWNNDGWQYNQPCTNYVTDQIVIKQRLVLALAPAASSWNPPANFNIQSTWPLGEEPWDGNPADITPTALISANQTTINQGQSIEFTYTGTVGNFPSQIHWDFGDGSDIVSNENPTHPFYNAGVYTTTATVIDSDGDTSTATMDITVLAGDIPPVATFIANQTNIKQDQSVEFTFTGILGNLPALVQWNFGDGTAIVTETDPIHKYTEAGTFTVIMTVTDNDGDTRTATMIITVEESTTEPPTTTTTTTTTTEPNDITAIPGYPVEFIFISGLLFIGYIVKKRKEHTLL